MMRVFLTILISGMLLAACGGTEPAAQASPGATATSEPVQTDNRITVDGRVVPVHSAELTFAATGVISDVLVAEGDEVGAGDVLARLNDAQQRAAVDQAEANLARAEAALDQLNLRPYREEIAAAEATLAEARANLDRVERQGGSDEEEAAAEASVRQAEIQLDVLRSSPRSPELAAAHAEVDAAEAALAQAEAAIADTELRAPFDGTIASLDLEVGEVPAPGAPVARLADVTEWQIETVDLTELNVATIREGDPATISIDGLPDLELRGTVKRIGRYGEEQQGDIVYKVVIALDQGDERLRWNMTAAVTIEPGE